MNTNFYTIEITSAAYDARYLREIRESQLASGKTTLLEKIVHLLTVIL